jgi:hypothetical protein
VRSRYFQGLIEKLLSPSSDIGNFLRQGSGLALSSIATGLNSFAIIFFGSRNIATTDFALFLIYWAAFNTILLTLIGPLDLLIPKQYPTWKSKGITSRAILRHILLLSTVASIVAVICIIPYLSSIKAEQISVYLGLILCAFAVNAFHALRIYFTATSNVRQVVALTISVGTLSIALLAILSNANQLTAPRIIFIVTLSHLIGVLYLLLIAFFRGGRRTNLVVNPERVNYKFAFPFAEYLQVMAITFIQLMLVSGVIIFATQIGIEPELVVTWVAIASLVRIPLLILNSFTPPVLNSASIQIHNNNLVKAKTLFRSSFATYAFASTMIVFGTALLAPILVPIFLGSNYSADWFTSLLVAIAEVTVALIVLPRVFLVVQGRAATLIKILFAGLIPFATVIILPISSTAKLFLAPTLSSILILTVTYKFVTKDRA